VLNCPVRMHEMKDCPSYSYFGCESLLSVRERCCFCLCNFYFAWLFNRGICGIVIFGFCSGYVTSEHVCIMCVVASLKCFTTVQFFEIMQAAKGSRCLELKSFLN
jgi:hypothetical protein